MSSPSSSPSSLARAGAYLLNKQNWADVVTVSRLVLAPLCTWLLVTAPHVGIWVATLFGLTDFVDGIFARRYGSHWWGGTLDALVDKWFTACIFTPLVLAGTLPWWACAILMARETLATVVRYYGQQMHAAIRTSAFGEIKTNVILWTCLVCFFDHVYWPGSGVPLFVGFGLLGMVITIIRRRTYFVAPRDKFLILPPNVLYITAFLVPLPLAMGIVMLAFSLGSFAEYVVVGFSAIRAGLREVPLARTLGLGLLALGPPATFSLFWLFPGQAWVVALVTALQCASFLVLLRYELWAAQRSQGGESAM